MLMYSFFSGFRNPTRSRVIWLEMVTVGGWSKIIIWYDGGDEDGIRKGVWVIGNNNSNKITITDEET